MDEKNNGVKKNCAESNKMMMMMYSWNVLCTGYASEIIDTKSVYIFFELYF